MDGDRRHVLLDDNSVRLKQNGLARLDQRRKQKFVCRVFAVREEIFGTIAQVLLLRVEELLAERGLDISYETVRCWVLKFGPVAYSSSASNQAGGALRWRLLRAR